MMLNNSVEKKSLIYSGKSKSLFYTENENLLLVEFRDDATAFNGVKHEKLADKGHVNNQINAFIMETLKSAGIPVAFEKVISKTHALIRHLKMIPLENVVRNIAAGSLCKRLGIESGKKLTPPIYELFLKNDALGDPFINEDHALAFHWATPSELKEMRQLTLKINEVLQNLFVKAGLILVDAKFEFGKGSDGKIYLGDEISPDSCRIWDAKTQEILDKDRFRQDLGNVVSSYQIIAQRLGITL